MQIGRIGDRDGQSVPPLVQGNDAMGGDQLAVYRRREDLRIVECAEIEQRIAERVRGETRDVRRLELVRLDQLLDERGPRGAGLR